MRLYKLGTPIGDLIETASNPGQRNDAMLIKQLGQDSVDYGAIIAQIRELVAE